MTAAEFHEAADKERAAAAEEAKEAAEAANAPVELEPTKELGDSTEIVEVDPVTGKPIAGPEMGTGSSSEIDGSKPPVDIDGAPALITGQPGAKPTAAPVPAET